MQERKEGVGVYSGHHNKYRGSAFSWTQVHFGSTDTPALDIQMKSSSGFQSQSGQFVF